MGWVSPVPAPQASLLALRGDSEVILGQPQRPAGLDALRDLKWAPVLALGTSLLQRKAENPRSGTSERFLTRCIGRNSPQVGVPVKRHFPPAFLSLEL